MHGDRLVHGPACRRHLVTADCPVDCLASLLGSRVLRRLALTGYVRSTLSEIELGRWLPRRGFWERSEQVLGLAPGHLTAPYDRLAPYGPGRPIGRGTARPMAMVIIWDDGTATTRLLAGDRDR